LEERDVARAAEWSAEIRDALAVAWAGGGAVTLQWPPAPPEDEAAQPQAPLPVVPVRAGLSDPRLIGGIAEITAMIAARLDDGAAAADVMPVIRDATRRWLEQTVRSGQLPASAGSQLDELAAAVHDRRYGLGPLSVYLRDPQVENVDINGCDQNLADSATRGD
jgi:hypothetical protein